LTIEKQSCGGKMYVGRSVGEGICGV